MTVEHLQGWTFCNFWGHSFLAFNHSCYENVFLFFFPRESFLLLPTLVSSLFTMLCLKSPAPPVPFGSGNNQIPHNLFSWLNKLSFHSLCTYTNIPSQLSSLLHSLFQCSSTNCLTPCLQFITSTFLLPFTLDWVTAMIMKLFKKRLQEHLH